ncbi:MAG: hypothetical protein ACI87O_000029 [Planctomycetota bacterium]|jgi:hypothetical protein
MMLSLLCWLPLLLGNPLATQPECPSSELASIADDGRGTPYRVEKADSICGLSEPRQLTVPAMVDFSKLLHATTEYKDLVRRKIDPASAEGTAILARANALVLDACEAVRTSGGYCSVWKKIARRDGGVIPEVTSQVLKGL